MTTYKAWSRLAATAAVAGGLGHPVAAATRTTSFGVSVTVMATCAISLAPKAGSAPACQPPSGAPRAIVAPAPVIKVTRDPKTSALIRIVEF